jgi:DNA gyrase subunit A
MPEDEASWGAMHLMFATRSGNVRRNELADFIHINRSGKIAMKLDEGDQIVGVRICTPDDDVLLVTANGRCIRFPVDDVRVFAGRTSTGVRGIRLGKDAQLGVDEVISITILRHVDADPAEARAYVKHANAMRRAALEEDEPDTAVVDNDDEADNGEEAEETTLTPERYAELGAAEQFLLTVSENGYGKRTSAFEYRVTGRGGKGIIAMAVTPRNGHLVASFPTDPDDQIMLVTDGGQLIRCPVNDIRVAGRSTQGVTIFNTAEDETVVSVERVSEVDVEVEDEPTDDGSGGAGTQGARP